MAKIHIVNSSVTEEYQDGENSYCEFFGPVPILQLAIPMELNLHPTINPVLGKLHITTQRTVKHNYMELMKPTFL
jgi:hypothetical protein